MDRRYSTRAPYTTGRPLQEGRRLRQLLRKAVWTMILVCLAVGTAGTTAWFTTPDVSEAPARVARAVAERHEHSDRGVIPVRVSAALIATEDQRFYTDPGVDPYAVARALRDGVFGGGNPGGAGLAQQLAKLLWTPDLHTIAAEAEQLTLAVKLDAAFTRRQILAMYLDEVYFGDNQFGITDAAHHYFGVPASRLSWAQASLLAGLVQAPSAYDPHLHLHLARLRQHHVLQRLIATGQLTAAQATAAAHAPLHPAIPFRG